MKSRHFDEFINRIKNAYKTHEGAAANYARAKARRSNVESQYSEMRKVGARRARYSDESDDEEDPEDKSIRYYIRSVMVKQQRDPRYYIGRKAFKILMTIAPEVIERFRKMRDDEMKTQGVWTPPNRNDGEGRVATDQPPDNVPKQYSNPMAMRTTADDDDISWDDQSSTDSRLTQLNFHTDSNEYKAIRAAYQAITASNTLYPVESDTHTTTARMCNTEIIDVHCNVIRGLPSTRRGWQTSTTDGGADTMILGRGWRKSYTDPNRTARIIGFDKKCAQKRDCPMGTGMAVTELSDGTL
jgi:hypothetical protein